MGGREASLRAGSQESALDRRGVVGERHCRERPHRMCGLDILRSRIAKQNA